MIVSVQAGRGSAAGAIGSAGRYAADQGSDDGLPDLVAHREEIRHRTIEGLAPDMSAGLGIDELRGDPDAFPHPAHAALDQEANTQLVPEPLHVDGLALEPESRVARSYRQRAPSRQLGDDVLGDAVGEIVLLRIASHVQERTDSG